MRQGRSVKVGSILSRDDRKASQGFVNIKSLTTEQLMELLERQNKLLLNRPFLEKLPDKGMKILSFKAEIEGELQKKQEGCNTACQLLFNLSLTDRKAEEIEWNEGKLSASEKQLDIDDDDDDDDDDEGEGEKGREIMINPLKYIATHSGTASGKKINVNSSESKLTLRGLNDVKKILYVDKYCEKYEKSNEINKERFKPNMLKNHDKTLFITSAENVKKRLGNNWEVTQATPPAPIYKDAVMISLSESLKLQQEQAAKLKDIEKKNATEKLLQNKTVKIGNKLPTHNVTEYRSTEDDEENENQDCDSED